MHVLLAEQVILPFRLFACFGWITPRGAGIFGRECDVHGAFLADRDGKVKFFHGEIFLGVITQNGMITLKNSQ